MKTNENWAEIVDTLHPYLDGSREKERYLKDIGNCLRFLGWRKTNGTMVSCPPEDRSSGKPDIVLLKRGKDAGLQAFPVMTESPGEMVYAMGLYIGDNIRLYYNENFCLRRYNLVRTGGSFLQWTEDFLSGSTGTGNVAGLLREKFMAEGFEESLVREELDKLGLRVSYKEGHAAITLRYPE